MCHPAHNAYISGLRRSELATYTIQHDHPLLGKTITVTKRFAWRASDVAKWEEEEIPPTEVYVMLAYKWTSGPKRYLGRMKFMVEVADSTDTIWNGLRNTPRRFSVDQDAIPSEVLV